MQYASNQQAITAFMKKYWWVWLVLAIVSFLILIIGPSVVGEFVNNVFSFLFTGALLVLLYTYTLGRGTMGIGGVLRLSGVLGVIVCCAIIFMWIDNKQIGNILWAKDTTTKTNLTIFATWGLIFLFFIGAGEMLVFLSKINYKLKLLNEKPVAHANEMLCPRCMGKGFVDFEDIKRLGKVDVWLPGSCNYCNAHGHVYRGKPLVVDPLDDSSERAAVESLDDDFEEWEKEYSKKKPVNEKSTSIDLFIQKLQHMKMDTSESEKQLNDLMKLSDEDLMAEYEKSKKRKATMIMRLSDRRNHSTTQHPQTISS